MNVLEEVNGSGQTLHANFEAFKFPTSSVVQFRALVTPCIPRYVCHRVTLWGQQINLNHPVYNSELEIKPWRFESRIRDLEAKSYNRFDFLVK